MFKKIFFLFLILFHSNISSVEKNKLVFHHTPKKIQDINLIDLNNENLSLKEFPKKIIIINFWATWCPPCIKEIPELLKLQEKFKNKLVVFFVSIDSSPEKVIPKFVKKNKFKNFNVFSDQDFKVSNLLKITKMPTTIIMKDQLELSRIEGYFNWLTPEVQKIIKKL
tara:strand:- start:3761 stop:4261 length:501 start_codon:yes stop_codon:yes gene_type:complete